MRFPSVTAPRRGRVRHGISRNIWLAVGRKVAFVAGVFFKRFKARGYTGSFSNLERLLAKWRNPKRKTPRPALPPLRTPAVDRATGRLISPILAAALCVKPRGLVHLLHDAEILANAI